MEAATRSTAAGNAPTCVRVHNKDIFLALLLRPICGEVRHSPGAQKANQVIKPSDHVDVIAIAASNGSCEKCRYALCHNGIKYVQALQRTNVPELPIFQSPADTSYHEADAALCQRITGKKGVAIAAGKDRTAAFLECFSSTPRPESAPGPSVQEYHNAYKQVLQRIC